jgi:hypothetical protein
MVTTLNQTIHINITVQTSDNPAGWEMREFIAILYALVSWLWRERFIVREVMIAIVSLGDVVEAGLEGCAIVWDCWVIMWQPMRGIV